MVLNNAVQGRLDLRWHSHFKVSPFSSSLPRKTTDVLLSLASFVTTYMVILTQTRSKDEKS